MLQTLNKPLTDHPEFKHNAPIKYTFLTMEGMLDVSTQKNDKPHITLINNQLQTKKRSYKTFPLHKIFEFCPTIVN